MNLSKNIGYIKNRTWIFFPNLDRNDDDPVSQTSLHIIYQVSLCSLFAGAYEKSLELMKKTSLVHHGVLECIPGIFLERLKSISLRCGVVVGSSRVGTLIQSMFCA